MPPWLTIHTIEFLHLCVKQVFFNTQKLCILTRSFIFDPKICQTGLFISVKKGVTRTSYRKLIKCIFCFLFSSWPERSGPAEWSALHHGGPDSEDVQGGQPGNGHDSQFNTDPWRGGQENQGTIVAYISALKGLLINVWVCICFHLSTQFCLCWYNFGMENLMSLEFPD